MIRSKIPTDSVQRKATIPGLQHAHPSELEAVARHTTALTVDSGTVLCTEGALGREAFVIVSGGADVIVHDTVVAHLTAGDVCGEIALLDQRRRTATVVTTSTTDLLVMSRGDFRSLLGAAPTFARRLLGNVSARLRDTDERIPAITAN